MSHAFVLVAHWIGDDSCAVGLSDALESVQKRAMRIIYSDDNTTVATTISV